MPPPMPADAPSLPDKLASVDLGRYEQVGCRGSRQRAVACTATRRHFQDASVAHAASLAGYDLI
jgi:hypothetical protein